MCLGGNVIVKSKDLQCAYYLPAAGRQIPKITYIAGAVCLLHFTDIALNLGTLRIVQLDQ